MANPPSQGTKVGKVYNSSVSGKQGPLISIPSIIGLPPSSTFSDNMITNSMPILQITPCIPNFTKGLTLFNLNEAKDQYANTLAELNYSASLPLSVAFIADNFPSLSFSNEWGEGLLQGATNIGSDLGGQLAFMLGQSTASGSANIIKNAINNMARDPKTGKAKTGAGADFARMTGAAVMGAENLINDLTQSTGMTNGINILDKLAGGSRIDFPHVWKGSSFSPSFSITVRLHTVTTQNDKDYHTNILGPLAALLCLGLPIQKDENNIYNFPFLCKIKCPGLFMMNPAAISSISVHLGGDVGLIGYNQRPSMIDVKIDFQSLYTSMVTGNASDRPSIGQLLDVLKDKATIENETPTSELDKMPVNIVDIETLNPTVSFDASNPTAVSPVAALRSQAKVPGNTLADLKKSFTAGINSIKATVSNIQAKVANAQSQVANVQRTIMSNVNQVESTIKEIQSVTHVVDTAISSVNSITAFPKLLTNQVSGFSSAQKTDLSATISKVQNFKPRF